MTLYILFGLQKKKIPLSYVLKWHLYYWLSTIESWAPVFYLHFAKNWNFISLKHCFMKSSHKTVIILNFNLRMLNCYVIINNIRTNIRVKFYTVFTKQDRCVIFKLLQNSIFNIFFFIIYLLLILWKTFLTKEFCQKSQRMLKILSQPSRCCYDWECDRSQFRCKFVLILFPLKTGFFFLLIFSTHRSRARHTVTQFVSSVTVNQLFSTLIRKKYTKSPTLHTKHFGKKEKEK